MTEGDAGGEVVRQSSLDAESRLHRIRRLQIVRKLIDRYRRFERRQLANRWYDWEGIQYRRISNDELLLIGSVESIGGQRKVLTNAIIEDAKATADTRLRR